MATNNPSIAKVQTEDRILEQIQSNIINPLNKLRSNKIVNNNFLEKVDLVVGSNSINHLLGRNLIGWAITRKRGSADIYDTQDNNAQPGTTLVLVSDAVVNVDIMVF